MRIRPRSDGRWYDHPVGQAQYIVNMLRNYRLKPDKVYLDLAIGHNFAMYGLYDYWRQTGSRDAAEMTRGRRPPSLVSPDANAPAGP